MEYVMTEIAGRNCNRNRLGTIPYFYIYLSWHFYSIANPVRICYFNFVTLKVVFPSDVNNIFLNILARNVVRPSAVFYIQTMPLADCVVEHAVMLADNFIEV